MGIGIRHRVRNGFTLINDIQLSYICLNLYEGILKISLTVIPHLSLPQIQHKMNIIEKIEANKKHILQELTEWAETFDCDLDEDGEKTLESYNYVFGLAERLDKKICSIKDYEDILFHIEQINYSEIKISL